MDASSIITGSYLLLLAVLVPGVSASLALFPRLDAISFSERLGFSLVFGFLPSLVLYFNVKNLNIPITETSSIVTYAGVTLFCLGVFFLRRSKNSG